LHPPQSRLPKFRFRQLTLTYPVRHIRLL
jgi:hypothetical protein